MLKISILFFKYLFRSLGIFLELSFGGILSLFFYMLISSTITPPNHPELSKPNRKEIAKNHYTIGQNYLRKNKEGVWEMYLEGDAYERGLHYGILAKELVQYQEVVFVKQIDELIPSAFWQRFLQMMLGFFNKDLPAHIALENQQEIYGISQSFSDDYNYIGTKYQRILNYHAAHDIGHALNDYSMVGCTSFSVKDDASEDGKLLIGRNFDFYVGDAFAKEKLLLFIKPTKGIPFATYSWAGFTGVASGMNTEGLSVTINASKSDLPKGTKTPIALLAREILQFASTTQEAIAIAKKRKVFVSETIMVTSSKEHKTILIEKSPQTMGVFDPSTNQVICSNHFQSNAFQNDPVNQDNIQNSDSKNRFTRVQELLNRKKKLNPIDVAFILRNQYGKKNDTLGMGNPAALNQLIAHHSVIMQPESCVFWISTPPFQLGAFKGYQLREFFKNPKNYNAQIRIEEDPFVKTEAFQQFLAFKKTKQRIFKFVTFGKPLALTPNEIEVFISQNGSYYHTYELLGDYFLKKQQKQMAGFYYQKALTKVLPSKQVKKEIELKLNRTY